MWVCALCPVDLDTATTHESFTWTLQPRTGPAGRRPGPDGYRRPRVIRERGGHAPRAPRSPRSGQGAPTDLRRRTGVPDHWRGDRRDPEAQPPVKHSSATRIRSLQKPSPRTWGSPPGLKGTPCHRPLVPPETTGAGEVNPANYTLGGGVHCQRRVEWGYSGGTGQTNLRPVGRWG